MSAAGPAAPTLSRLAPGDRPELEAFFAALPMRLPAANLDQFSLPRSVGPGFEVVTLALREGGRMIGTVGWIGVPMTVRDALGGPSGTQTLRWPLNLYLLPECRGRGLGRQLMEAAREGAAVRAVIGGNEFSKPLLDRMGWTVIGHLAAARWLRPCPDPRRLGERLGRTARRPPPAVVALRRDGARIEAHRVPSLTGWLPWASTDRRGAAAEAGVERDAAFLAFAFGGALAPWHSLHAVSVDGALSGFFVLAARGGRRGILASEIVDLDAVAGRELPVIAAARATGLACADVVHLRMSGARFTAAMAALAGRRGLVRDHPLRISCDAARAIPGPYLSGGAAWRLTYGDHDQYRIRGGSLAWSGAQAPPPTGEDR